MPCSYCQPPQPRCGPRFGEGYFQGLWYCGDCWDAWQDAPPEMVTISPWPLEAGRAGDKKLMLDGDDENMMEYEIMINQ